MGLGPRGDSGLGLDFDCGCRFNGRKICTRTNLVCQSAGSCVGEKLSMLKKADCKCCRGRKRIEAGKCGLSLLCDFSR